MKAKVHLVVATLSLILFALHIIKCDDNLIVKILLLIVYGMNFIVFVQMNRDGKNECTIDKPNKQ